jgi:type I restriction enzyme M protein
MMNELYKNTKEIVELAYVIEAWKKLSNDGKIKNEFTFNKFYTQKIDIKKLASIFNELAKDIKLFKLYHFDVNKFNNDKLIEILGFVKNNVEKLQKINDFFYLNKNSISYVSDQIAELGIKLLNGDSKEIYVPFTYGFTYVNYTDKKIYADNQQPKSKFIAELINILENKKIEFSVTDSLIEPTFINPDAPHLLKQFDSVLSFPPFHMQGALDTSKDKFHRYKFQRGRVLDIAHFEHILAQTKLKAVVLMSVGFTYRSGAEERFRQYLIENNYIEAILQLPTNILHNTSIESTFFVINKQKNNDKVLFINLKNEKTIKKDIKKIVFKSIDDIVDIYKNKKEIEEISCLVTNKDIANNNYSLSIDRYVIPKKVKELQKILEQFETVKLEDIADIRRSQLFRNESEGKKIYEISPSNFNQAGYTLECGKIKQIGSQENRLQTYKLESYDILLSTKGIIGKVAIIGDISKDMIASQAIQVIRLKDENKIEKAIILYMFLKSDLGQMMLSTLKSGTAMPQIATSEIKKLQIPVLTKEQEKQVILNFNNEIKMYDEIEKINTKIKSIHSNFLK